MTDTAPKAELLRSLGRLARGLSALFWGLPLSLIVCVQTAETQTLRTFNILPPLIMTCLLAYGLWQLGYFQRQERIWTLALGKAKMLALVNLCLSPFLFWWNQQPEQQFFVVVVGVLAVSGLLFLSSLNLVLYRLSAMLPDEGLREETKHFTTLNRFILFGILLLAVVLYCLRWFAPQFLWSVTPESLLRTNLGINNSGGSWLLMFLALLPLAMTMALVWKIKEVILESVFGAGE